MNPLLPLYKSHGFSIAFASLLLATSLLAESASDVWPMPSHMPSVPSGTNIASYPLPRLDWVVRVNSNNVSAKSKASSIDLVFDGDSITDGWQGRGRAVWISHYEKLKAFDFGIGGDCTQNVIWRLTQGQMDGLHPKLIALMIGTNNIGGNTPEQIAGGITTIVQEYRKRCPDSVILLQAILPRGNLPTDPFRAKIKSTNEIISKLDDGKKIIYIDFGDQFLSPDGTLSPDIMPDYLHPNEKGYEIWAKAIQPVIDKYFQSHP